MQTTTAQQDVRRILDKMIAAAKNNPEVERLSCELEMLTMAYTLPSLDDFWTEKLGLTSSEARIVRLLNDKFGQSISKEAMMNALYFDRPGDEPDYKIVDVFICKIRKKLKGSPYAIEHSWGRGYRMTRVSEAKLAA